MNSMSMAMSSSSLMTAPVSASSSGSPSATTATVAATATGASLTIGNPIDSSFLFFPRQQEQITLNQPFNPMAVGRSLVDRLPASNLPSAAPYSANGE